VCKSGRKSIRSGECNGVIEGEKGKRPNGERGIYKDEDKGSKKLLVGIRERLSPSEMKRKNTGSRKEKKREEEMEEGHYAKGWEVWTRLKKKWIRATVLEPHQNSTGGTTGSPRSE